MATAPGLRMRASVGAALAGVVLVLGFAGVHQAELRFRFELWRFRRTDPARVSEAARALLSRGELGVSVVESVAFDSDLAPMDSETRAFRQTALDALWEKDSDGVTA